MQREEDLEAPAGEPAPALLGRVSWQPRNAPRWELQAGRLPLASGSGFLAGHPAGGLPVGALISPCLPRSPPSVEPGHPWGKGPKTHGWKGKAHLRWPGLCALLRLGETSGALEASKAGNPG